MTQWNEAGEAEVEYRGAKWTARTLEGEEKAAGVYEIAKIEGSVLYLKKAS